MHTGDDRVCGDNETLSRAAIDDRRIIKQAETARPGERRKKAPNALELTHGFSGAAAQHGC
jgi:hypothetical protein